jgi:hypothetical protein
MDYGAILNVGAIAKIYPVVVGTYDAIEPNADSASEPNASNDLSAWRDVVVTVHGIHLFVAKRIDHVSASPPQSE